MPNTPNERFMIEFNAIKLLTMALTKIVLDNAKESDKAANQLIGLINTHVQTQRIEGLDVEETKALREAIAHRVEAIVNAVKTKPTYLR